MTLEQCRKNDLAGSATGLPLIDEDHDVLFYLMERVDEIVVGGFVTDSLRIHVSDFIEYCLFHFRREEILAAGTEFDDLDRHAGEHLHLSVALVQLEDRLDRSVGTSSGTAFAGSWAALCVKLRQHMDLTDRPLARHIRSWLASNGLKASCLEERLLRFAR